MGGGLLLHIYLWNRCGDNPILRLVVGNSEMSAAGEGSSKQEVVSSPVGQVGKSSVSLTTKKPPIPGTGKGLCGLYTSGI